MTRISTAEVPQFLFDLEKTKMNEQIRLYLKIMMLVFVRKDELLGAKWDEFDFDAEVWHVDWQGIVKLTSAKCKIPNFILTLMHSTDFGLWSAMNPNCV